MPGQLRELIAPIPVESLVSRPQGQEFSLKEHVFHLIDLEREGHGARIRRILTEESPRLEDIDGSRLTQERNYQSLDFSAALGDFEGLRLRNIEILRECSPGQWSHSGELEGVGRLSLRQLVERILQHDRSHLSEMGDLRKVLRSEA